jgi:thioredoxin reductase
VPGLFAAGDCSRDVQLVIIAAAEGARAAFAMNKEMIRQDLENALRARRRRS